MAFCSDTDCDDQNVDQYQSRNLYADLLPHSEFIPEEADKWWSWIKMNLPRCVEAMEIRPGLLQVDRYLRVYISLHRNGFIFYYEQVSESDLQHMSKYKTNKGFVSLVLNIFS